MSTSDLIFIVGVPISLLGLALFTIVMAHRRKAALIRELTDVTGFLGGLQNASFSGTALIRATRAHLIRSSSTSDERLILTSSLAAVRREYAEDELGHHWAFWFGGLLTGLALLVTFVLIAYVMTNDISGAIRATSAEEGSAMDSLASAVNTLGGKFYISAAGIGGSVFALFLTNHARSAVIRCAEHPDGQLVAAFTTVQELELELRLAGITRDQADRDVRHDHHKEICGKFDQIDARLMKLDALDLGLQNVHREIANNLKGMLTNKLDKIDESLGKLGNIEVCVQDIGAEVSANLKGVMKEAMAEEFRSILTQMMGEVGGIATTVEKNISSSFTSTLQTLGESMKTSLGSLEKVIQGQAQGQVEKLLDQLRATVSGGFQSEAKDMSAALASFAKVIPALETQLKAMTTQMRVEVRQQSEEGAKMNQVLFQRLDGLLHALATQQTTNADAAERMQQASTASAEEFARRVESSGASMVSTVLGASRAEMEAISAQLRVAMDEVGSKLRVTLDASATHGADLSQRTATASDAVARAAEALSVSAHGVAQLSQHTQAILQQVQASAGGMDVAARGFQQAGGVAIEASQAMRAIVDTNRQQTHEQMQLLLKQREYTKEVEALWPQLFETYLRKFREGADDLARSWGDFHTKMQVASQAVGSEFAESTQSLSESVDKLVAIQHAQRAR